MAYQKKVCDPEEGYCDILGNGQEMPVMVGNGKKTIMIIQVNFCCLLHVSLGFGTRLT